MALPDAASLKEGFETGDACVGRGDVGLPLALAADARGRPGRPPTTTPRHRPARDAPWCRARPRASLDHPAGPLRLLRRGRT